MKLKLTFETMKLDDQVVAVPVGDNASDFQGVVKLNETAAFIFELLRQDITEEEIILAMQKEFDVSKDILARDVRRYIEQFQEKGLLS